MEMLWRSERTKYYALKSLKQNAKVRAMKGKLGQFLQFLDFYGFLWISWSLAPLSVSSCVWVSRTGFPALSFRVSSLESVKSHWVAAKPILPKSLEGGQTSILCMLSFTQGTWVYNGLYMWPHSEPAQPCSAMQTIQYQFSQPVWQAKLVLAPVSGRELVLHALTQAGCLPERGLWKF